MLESDLAAYLEKERARTIAEQQQVFEAQAEAQREKAAEQAMAERLAAMGRKRMRRKGH